jgi:hypothetical protein
MDLLLVGTFPDGADLCHVSTNINGPDLVANSRIAISCDKISTCSRTPILRVPTLSRILTRVLLEIYGYDPSSGFRESQGLDSLEF